MDTEIIDGAKTVFLFCRMQMRKNLDIPIRASEIGVLIYVHQTEEAVTPRSLSEYFRMRRPSVSAMIKTLVNRGYLKKKPSEEDGRSYGLLCTKKGSELVEYAFDDYHRSIGQLRDGMGSEKFNRFIGLLDEANTILEKERVG